MKEQPLSKNELQLFNRRDFLIKGGLAASFFGLAWRLWDLQIIDGQKYSDLAKRNGIRKESIPAPRGIIYDRNGIVLSKNIPGGMVQHLPGL